MRIFGWLLMLALGGLALPSASPAQKPVELPEQLQRLHVLIVINDTDGNPHFNEGLRYDLSRLQETLEQTIPRDRFRCTVLKGSKASGKEILAYYRQLQVRPNEAVLCFYGGHGAIPKGAKDVEKHFFKLVGGDMHRKELLAAMEAKKAGLTVLISDCCSSQGTFVPPKPVYGATEFRSVMLDISPLMRSLFFRAWGTVDLTASAPGEPSWGDNQGGVFTRTLCRMLRNKTVAAFDSNGDALVSWEEFFPKLRQATSKNFQQWRREAIARPGSKAAKISENQTPYAFALGRAAPSLKEAPSRKTIALIGIRNGNDFVLEYKLRWEGSTRWEEVQLPPGATKAHQRELSGEEELPTAEVQIIRAKPLAPFRSHEGSKSNDPEKALRSVYVITKKKN